MRDERRCRPHLSSPRSPRPRGERWARHRRSCLIVLGRYPPTVTELRIGSFTPAAPVVLAPMAGVTNAPFRTMCREFAGSRLRERDGDGHRGGARQCEDRADDDLRTRRTAAEPAGVRQRPGDDRRGDPQAVCPWPCRPHRHELRLPGGHGHPQGRRRRRCPPSPTCCGRSSSPPLSLPPSPYGAGDGLFRKGLYDSLLTFVSTGPHRRRGGHRRDRAARPHRRAALRRYRRLGRDR